MPPPVGSSDVWQSFRKIDKDTAACKICFKVLKSSGNTSNLKKHLKTHNQQNLKKATTSSNKGPIQSKLRSDQDRASTSKADQQNIMESEADEETEIVTTSQKQDDNNSTSIITASTSSKRVDEGEQLLKSRSSSFQLTLAETFQRAASYTEGAIQYEGLIKHLLYFIAVDNRPFHIIQGEGFRRLFKMLSPNMKLPSEDTLKRRLDDIYDVTLSKYIKRLNTIAAKSYYALTFDIWSEMMSTRSFLGVTIHFLEDDAIQSKILMTKPLHERHTGQNIVEHLEDCINTFQLKKQNIAAAVTDNGSNVVAAVNAFLEPAKHLPCFAHTINRVVENMLELESIKGLISKVRDIVKFFKGSVINSDLLRKKQGHNTKKLILDVKTRWNSTFYMIDRYTQMRSVVNEILLEKQNAPDILTAFENNVLQKIMLVLQPFEYVTKDICGEKYATTSKIIPTINCLRAQINDIRPQGDENGIIVPLKDLAIKELNSRFGQIENNVILAVSTLLDPRFKNIHFIDANACARAISFIRRTISADDTSPPTVPSSESENESDKYDFWSLHKKLAHSRPNRRLDIEKDETSLYLASPVSSLKSDPFIQWSEMKTVFPKLYSMATKYLIIPGTSVPSERLFSKAGAVVTSARNRLTGSRVNKLLFMSDCDPKDWELIS